MNVLKACGDYIKRLMFPDHVPPTSLIGMLSHCKNVTQLSLPPETKIDSEELRLAVQHMKHLEKLEVQLCTGIKPLLQIGGLKGLTVHVPKEHHSSCGPFVQVWIMRRCIPCNFSIITERFNFYKEVGFLESLLRPYFTPLMGYTSFFKLYYYFEVPLNLFQNLPVFQFEFGKNTVHPFIDANDVGITGLDWPVLALTDTPCNGKRASIASNAVRDIFERRNFSLNVDSLACVTEFSCQFLDDSFKSHQLEQLALACPNLQRLNLQGNDCLHSLKGLRAIVSHCPDVCGLNLMYIGVEQVESHLGLWELLSKMKLTHLFVDTCLFCGDSDEEKLVQLFQKCSSLQALQIERCYYHHNCEKCTKCRVNWSLLSHFPVLKYCRFSPDHSTVLQDIINGCKQLTILSCNCFNSKSLSVSSVSTCHLQQLSITKLKTNIPDIFMETVSAHGGLVHVAFDVLSVSAEGITSLVDNSPGLLTCNISVQQSITHDQDDFEGYLKQRFLRRKLFNVGRFTMQGRSDCIPRTDLYPLWHCHEMLFV
ncbi:uncharacterized protein [Dysidea avara]|uniref:uncharacterized protein n=1 Tax=Dysidea avara TaxID=196820 RepID=UPI0033339412